MVNIPLINYVKQDQTLQMDISSHLRSWSLTAFQKLEATLAFEYLKSPNVLRLWSMPVFHKVKAKSWNESCFEYLKSTQVFQDLDACHSFKVSKLANVLKSQRLAMFKIHKLANVSKTRKLAVDILKPDKVLRSWSLAKFWDLEAWQTLEISKPGKVSRSRSLTNFRGLVAWQSSKI